MLLFFCKQPCTKPRVLDVNDCPPHNLAHDISSYPSFYDPLCYPDEYPTVFATADGFCQWLESALMNHLQLCRRCCSVQCVIGVTSQPPNISVSIDGTLMLFTPAHFESPTYVHCSVFKHYEVYQANLSMEACLLSSLIQDPPWFSYPIDHYCEAVPALPATVLHTVACDLGCDKSESHQKELSTDVILQHFVAACLEFLGLTNDVIVQCLGASLPLDSLKFRGTYLAAGVVHLYGTDITAALHCSLIHNSSIDESNRAHAHSSVSWASFALDDLMHHLERLSREQILCSIHGLLKPPMGSAMKSDI